MYMKRESYEEREKTKKEQKDGRKEEV